MMFQFLLLLLASISSYARHFSFPVFHPAQWVSSGRIPEQSKLKYCQKKKLLFLTIMSCSPYWICFLTSVTYINRPKCSSQEQTVSTFQCLKGSEGSELEMWSESLDPALDLLMIIFKY